MSLDYKRIAAALALGLVGFSLSVMSASEAFERSAKTAPATESLVLGGGCFWCVEALYETIDGVAAVQSGYAGGTVANPTYEQVTSGRTGHAEVVRITYDPDTVKLEELLEFFWEAHDPTTLNRQGADVGTQYRSVILFTDQRQRDAAEASKAAAQARFARPIVTEIAPLEAFYPAEGYHQDYFKNNPDAPYCRYVIAPKLKKLES
jgi:peptide-methionine (S)-S-oxide reductase